LIELSKEIGDLETISETNIAENKEFVEFNLKELAGVPRPILRKLLKENPVPGKKGFVKIALEKKSGGYMATFKNENTRKKMK